MYQPLHSLPNISEPLIPALASFKNQYEISQRFYISEGQGITAEEAYRFLCNRWFEKKMLARRKVQVTPEAGDAVKKHRKKK